jgi:4-oxalocrotonate tautomerase
LIFTSIISVDALSVNEHWERHAMPFIHVKLAGQDLAADITHHLQRETTKLMETIMRKRPEVTVVLVEKTELSGWSVGGAAIPVAAHVEANVTLGTNTPEEKERFIKAMTDLLKECLGEKLAVATYVIVREVDADAWGYDGLTQKRRRRAVA